MNTDNFTPFPYNKDTWLKETIQKQKELVFRYNAFEPNKIKDFDINTYVDQQIFKDYLQIRFTEELTEALTDTKNYTHFKEEMTDAFNFILSSYIISDYEDYLTWEEDLNENFDIKDLPLLKEKFWDIVQKVGDVCNLLKNRPWRMSQYLVDLYVFEKRYKELWQEFNALCNFLNISQEEVFKYWSLKFQVNEFRLNTRY